MQFSVPQFIHIEDKIIGPLTLKQFLWCLAGAIILFILWTFAPMALFIILALPIAALFAALAFYKYNGRPLVYLFFNGLKFFVKPKLYLFQKAQKSKKDIIEKPAEIKQVLPKIKPQLSDLAWKLDAK
ncbi:MAG: PrgI family protein [bacterium]